MIQIFAKPPVAGKVKTRLIPDLGTERATQVYRYCVKRTLDLVQILSYEYEIWLGEPSDDAIFGQQTRLIQQGDNLGSRMFHALKHGLDKPGQEAVILIGSDCLDLNPNHIHLATDALKTQDLVLLPCYDGGFALIGCRRIEASLFDNVTWSSDKVLHQTLQNVNRLGYRVTLLETVRDIDTLPDLDHYPALREIAEDI